MIAVVTVIGDGEPRRVAIAVPAVLGPQLVKQPVTLLTHPSSREVAVLDDRVDAATLEQIDADPRWWSERLPTDRSVVGGWGALAVVFLLVYVVAFGVGYLATVLAT